MMDACIARVLVGALLACASVCALGCSGGDGEDGAGGAGGSGGGGGSGVAGGGSGGAGMGSGGAGAGSGGAGASGGSGAGGSAGNAPSAGSGGSGAPLEATLENLFPLAVGNRWSYLVTIPIPSVACVAGEHATELVASAIVDGRDAFEVRHVCDVGMPAAIRYYAYTERGFEAKRCYDGAASCEGPSAWSLILPRAIVDQSSFGASGETRTLHRVGTVTLPAGTFEECWETRGAETPPLVSVYCAGVGPVAFRQKDPAMPPTVDYELELTSFELH